MADFSFRLKVLSASNFPSFKLNILGCDVEKVFTVGMLVLRGQMALP